jgi:hypothetical protein
VCGAAKRERLDDLALRQSASDLTRPGSFAPCTYGELGRSVELGRDGAQAAHHPCHRVGADRVEKLLPHPPGEGLRPAQ